MSTMQCALRDALVEAGYVHDFESATGGAWRVNAFKGAGVITIASQPDAPKLSDDMWVLCRNNDPIEYDSAEDLVKIVARFKSIEKFAICEQNRHLYGCVN